MPVTKFLKEGLWSAKTDNGVITTFGTSEQEALERLEKACEKLPELVTPDVRKQA